MEEKTVILPEAPEGYEYILRKKSPLSGKDPSELTAKQRAGKKYREKNRQELNEKKRLKKEEGKKKEEKV
jgi:hypothetical protein